MWLVCHYNQYPVKMTQINIQGKSTIVMSLYIEKSVIVGGQTDIGCCGNK